MTIMGWNPQQPEDEQSIAEITQTVQEMAREVEQPSGPLPGTEQ